MDNEAAFLKFVDYHNREFLELPADARLKILERCYQADQRRIASKAFTVGHNREIKIEITSKEDTWLSDGISPGYDIVTIFDDGKTVFNSCLGSLPRVYLPGNWETALDRLYEAKVLQNENEKVRKAQEAEAAKQAQIKKSLESYGL